MVLVQELVQLPVLPVVVQKPLEVQLLPPSWLLLLLVLTMAWPLPLLLLPDLEDRRARSDTLESLCEVLLQLLLAGSVDTPS